MTTTIGTLMDGVHSRAWRLNSTTSVDLSGHDRHERAAALLAAWSKLATSSLRVLDAVRVEPAWMGDTATAREV